MIRRLAWTLAVAVVASPAAWAQDPRVEISGTAGWTFSDGVSGGAEGTLGDFTRVDPKDAFSWGARLGFMVNENVEVGGLFNMQSTKMELAGATGSPFEVADWTIYNYHGYFAYNFGASDAAVRPYVLGGLGVTQFGSLSLAVAGASREVGGDTKFSSTWAAGVKVFPGGNNFGIRLEGRWTPTYIKSDEAGWWCDPYWGCYVVGDAQYANQWELSGGIVLRF